VTLGPRFWRLFAASATSNVGDGLYITAIFLLAATLTRDPFEISIVTALFFLPWLLFALPSGAVVDSVDRRRAMVFTGIFRTAVMGCLTLTIVLDAVSMPVVYVVVFLLGTAETMYESATRALLPAVVDREGLDAGNARLAGAQTIGQEFATPPLAGALFAVTSAIPFVGATVSFGMATVLAASLPGRYRAAPEGDSRERPRMRAQIREGLVWVRGNRTIHTLMIFGGITGFAGAGTNGVMVLFATDELGLDETGFGLLITSVAAGAVVGSLNATWLSRRFGRGPAILGSWVVTGIGYAGFGLSTHAVVAGAWFALAGWGVMVSNVLTMSLRQALIPEALFGRVLGAWRTVVWGVMPLGAAAGGLLAQAAGLRAPMLAMGLVSVLVAVGGARQLLGSDDDARCQTVEFEPVGDMTSDAVDVHAPSAR